MDNLAQQPTRVNTPSWLRELARLALAEASLEHVRPTSGVGRLAADFLEGLAEEWAERAAGLPISAGHFEELRRRDGAAR